MIAVAIAVCEVAFWALVLGGLTVRYVLGRRRLGSILLVATPLVDLLLLTVTAIDLAGGAQAGTTHGLAAAYLGFSVVLGPSLVRSADRRFAHRFADGPPPQPQRDPVGAEWRLWGRCLLSCAIAAGLLGFLILVPGEPDRTRVLWEGGGWFAQLGIICVIWFLAGPVWAMASRRREPSAVR
jgi:hypothetical protein